MTSLITTYVPSIEKFIDPIANKPFNEIPQSLFENCNHMTKNTYTQEEFEELRRLTTSTPEKEISDLCTRLVLKQYPNLPSKDLQQHIYRKKEELDWIYGLDKLEKDILKHENPQQALENALKTDQIIKYNGYFIRSTMPSESGKFRTQPLFCYKRDLTDAEVFTGNLLQVIGFQYGKNITPY
jgi:hypothetical protein